ncbi:MAG: competence protein ComEC [Planctomycetota bacterium]
MTKNKATEIIWPTDSKIVVRAVFLYVGQGSSTLFLIRNGSTYDCWLVDINLDSSAGGIDIPKMMKDLLGETSLRAFVNTHPHNDHLHGISELHETLSGIDEILHSNHKPSKEYGSRHDDLLKVIKKVTKAGGEETILEGSKSPVDIADAKYHVLAPAKYVTDDVNDETPEKRKQRIHEHCGVVKFGKEDDWIMVVGDADRAAFENHITDYHKDRLGAFALAGSHHGSRTFFMEKKGDDPYMDGLEAIDPSYTFISAPKRKESPHDHPHEEAMKLYREQCGDDNVYHLGDERLSYIVDIFDDGTYGDVEDDDGDLSADYGLEGEKVESKSTSNAAGPFVRPRTATGDQVPRKYG